MSEYRERKERTESLLVRFRELRISCRQLHMLTVAADPSNGRRKGVGYLTIRRICLNGTIPTMRTLDKIEAALATEERQRDRSAASAA